MNDCQRKRTHELIFEDEDRSVYLIAWPYGTGLDWHDHGTSNAEITVVAGTLTEYTSSFGLNPNDGYAHTPEEVEKWQVPFGVFHKVINHDEETAVSVHIYRPPLTVDYDADLEL